VSVLSTRTIGRSSSPLTEAKLAIAVELHGLSGSVQCAQAAARWLAETVGAEQVLCVGRALDEPNQLMFYASHGLSAEALRLFSLDTGETSPLAPVLAGREEATIEIDHPGAEEGPARAPSMLALPLGDTAGNEPVGVILVGPRQPAIEREARWLARILGPRLATHVMTGRSRLQTLGERRRATQEIESSLEKMRLAEARAREERDRLDLIIDSVDDPIVATDAGGHVLHLNQPAEHLLLPAPRASLEQRRIAQANEARLSSLSSNLMFGGKSTRWRGEVSLTDPETRVTTCFDAVAGKVVSEAGELKAIVTVLHDRTEAIEKARLYETIERASRTLEQKVSDATAELVRQNEVLRRQHIALEEASRLKSLFLANMSHEFRTPLNAILGYTSMMLEGVGGELSRVHARNLQRIDSNAHHLAAIISDILDISKIEAGKMPIHLGWFGLAELVSEVMAELEPLVARSGLAVSVRVAARIPAIYSDRPKLKQILLNLLSNAIKFTPEGSLQVTAKLTDAGERVAISVQDTGIGIAPEHQEAVFEDFRQVDSSTTRQYEGTGLGLSICRRLAEALGGKIRLSSVVGKGSTFTLVVPRKARRK
jgi:signal transduction histidine kinase